MTPGDIAISAMPQADGIIKLRHLAVLSDTRYFFASSHVQTHDFMLPKAGPAGFCASGNRGTKFWL